MWGLVGAGVRSGKIRSHPKFCHWAWAPWPVGLDMSWFCPLSFWAPFIQKPPLPDSLLLALGWASEPGLDSRGSPLPRPQAFVQGGATTLVNQGESVLGFGCHWGREVYCLSGRMWAWSCWGHLCHPVGTASLRMKSTQRNKGWEMELTIPYKTWAQSCLTPGLWVNHLPFCLSQAELDFSPSPTKSECWLLHNQRVLHSLGTPDSRAQWLRLCHAPGVHQGGKEDCFEWTRTRKKARSNSLHHCPLPPSSLLSALPTRMARVCPPLCFTGKQNLDAGRYYNFNNLWIPWRPITDTSLYYAEAQFVLNTIIAGERSKSLPWGVSLAYRLHPRLLKGTLHALGMASCLGTHRSPGTVPIGLLWVSSGRNRLLLVEHLLLCQALYQVFHVHTMYVSSRQSGERDHRPHGTIEGTQGQRGKWLPKVTKHLWWSWYSFLGLENMLFP